MWTRRTVVGTACATVLVAGCLEEESDAGEEGSDGTEGADAEEESDGYDPRLDEIDAYDPVDRTGESEITIDISSEGEPAFDPDPVVVDSNTEVRWRWGDSDGAIEPVEMHSPCQWSGSDGGSSHSWMFPFEGKYVIGYSSSDVEEVTGTMFVVDP